MQRARRVALTVVFPPHLHISYRFRHESGERSPTSARRSYRSQAFVIEVVDDLFRGAQSDNGLSSVRLNEGVGETSGIVGGSVLRTSHAAGLRVPGNSASQKGHRPTLK
ncbi:hypothetical protein HRbin30_01189 [bacterium HR30]|nr:hypothetical protein HRbin30_01189 [bacterium HR30]